MVRKAINESRILKEMFVGNLGTRQELGRRFGLCKASVTHIVKRLIDADMIMEESRINRTDRGRKTTLFRLRPDIAYFVGTDIEGLALRVCIIDSNKRVIQCEKNVISPSWSTKKILEHWSDLIKKVIENSDVKVSKIAGIGIGLPGRVSKGDFKSRAFLPPGRWMDIDAGTILKNLNLQAAAANNGYCIAEYEKNLGAAKKEKNFISILIRYGIGIAFYIDGMLHNGEQFFTGEFGHMRVDPHGPECVCGQKGCLDVFVSGRTWTTSEVPGQKFEKELTLRAQYLAIGLANLLKSFYFPVVIIDGIYNVYEYLFKTALLEALGQELKGLELPIPKIVFGDATEFKTSIGAALMGASKFSENYFENITR